MYRPTVGWTGRSWSGRAVTREERKIIEERGLALYNSEYSQEEKEAASASVFRDIANHILPKSIRMVEDTPGKHQSGFLPILDTEMRIENGRIVFRHYSKPMSSNEVVNARSAMSKGNQISILVQESNRILRNCDHKLPWSV